MKKLTKRYRLAWVAAVFAAAAFCSLCRANDWPQWGGRPIRNMYSSEKGLPDRVDPGKINPDTGDVDLSTAKNVKWAVQLGSQSYGNATVAGGRVFVGTNNEHPRDPQHQGDRSILMCFDEKTGAFLWQLVAPKLASGKVNDWENLGILSSPTVDGNHVYLVTSRCEVVCLDVAGMANGNQGPFLDEAHYVTGPGKPPAKIGPHDADIIWRYDMINELGVFPHNASNCSVLILGNILYACTSNGMDWTHVNIPSPFAPSLIALDKNTGKLLATDDAGIGPHIFHGQWCSPTAGIVNGRTLIFFGGGDGFCYAFNPQPIKKDDDTVLDVVWKFDANPPEYKFKNGQPIKYPDPNGPSEINATPVFYKNRVYVAIGQDPEHGEGIGRLICIDATQKGDITKTGLVWDYRGIHRSLSTVSIDPETGLLFVGDFSGFVHCLDAETGKVYWVHDMKAHMWGSTMVADGKVYFGDEDGDFIVMSASKDEKVISQTNLGDPVYSTPVVANGVVYVATTSHLFALTDNARNASPDQPAKIEIK